MAQRSYTVYLKGGASFTLKASRFEVTDRGVFFFDEDGQPPENTFVDPSAVIAVVPPGSAPRGGFLSMTHPETRASQ